MVKISIGVMATAIHKKYADQIQACLDTWVQDGKNNNISTYFFVGYHKDDRFPLINLPNVKEDYNSAFHKQFHGLKWMLDNDPSDFYMVVGTDTYININNLISLLQKYHNNTNLYIGGHGSKIQIGSEHLYYHSGGSGFIIDHQVLNKIFTLFTPARIYEIWNKQCVKNNRQDLLPACDVTISWLCQNILFIEPTIVDHFYGCNNKNRYNDDSASCNGCNSIENPDKIISCHFMDPPLMREYHDYTKFSFTKEIVQNWTVVTCFYHLPRYGNDFNKPIDFYLNNGKFVLSLPVNLVVYCDKEEYDFIYNYRKEHGFENNTKIIVKSLYDFDLYKYIDTIKNNRANNNIYLNNRNTPTYCVLTSSKFDLMAQSIMANYFNDQYYAWLDFGLMYCVGNYPNQIIRALQQYRDKASFMMIEYIPENVVRNNQLYYQNGGMRSIAGGFWTGNKDYLYNVCIEGHKIFIDTVNAGYGHSEQNIIPIIYFNNPNWFELYYGDYWQLLNNYDKIRLNLENSVKHVIFYARQYGSYKICQQCCIQVLNAVNNLDANLNLELLFKVLDDYFISSYYLNNIDDCIIALKLFSKYEQLYKDGFKSYYNSYGAHIIRNSDHLYQNIKHLTPNGEICIENKNNDDNDDDIQELINQGYKVFIYGDYSISSKSLIINNPVYRPLSIKFNTDYVKTIKNEIGTYNIAILLTLCSRNCNFNDITEVPLFKSLYPSIIKTAPNNANIKIIVGYDDDDLYYDKNVKDITKNGIEVYKLYNCQNAPARAWNKLFNIAYYHETKFDYFWQIGDDVVIENEWYDKFITKLNQHNDIGVVGPCEPFNYNQRVKGNIPWIIENVMISRKHFMIFSTLFNYNIKNWFCDNWITEVYRPFNSFIFTDVKCKNSIRDARYKIEHPTNLQQLITAGITKVRNFIDGQKVKVFSFCIYGTNKKYCQGLIENIKIIQNNYPDFEVWIYGGFDVPVEYVNKYHQFTNVRYIELPYNDLTLMYYRFMPIDNSNVELCFIRDADSRIGERDQWCINQFINNDMKFHIIRDHNQHKLRIMGGMWGIKQGILNESIQEMFYIWKDKTNHKLTDYRSDQYFLQDCIYNLIKNDVLIHSDYNFYSDENISKIECDNTSNNFVGNVYDYKDEQEIIIYSK